MKRQMTGGRWQVAGGKWQVVVKGRRVQPYRLQHTSLGGAHINGDLAQVDGGKWSLGRAINYATNIINGGLQSCHLVRLNLGNDVIGIDCISRLCSRRGCEETSLVCLTTGLSFLSNIPECR